MKRIWLTVLVLCLCLSVGAAEKINCFVPEQMSQAMNEIMPLVMNALDIKDMSVVRSATEYLSLSFTETQERTMYYNNQDWNVELSFYFPGAAGTRKESDAVNFSVSRNLNDTQLKVLLYTFALAACYDNPEMDRYSLISYLTETATEYDSLTTAIGTFSYVPDDEVYHFVLLKTEYGYQQSSNAGSMQGTQLISTRYFTMELTDIRPFVSKDYPAALVVDVQLTNKTNKTLYVAIENASVSGKAVKGIGIYDIAPKSRQVSEYFILQGETQAAINAIGSAREAVMNIVVCDEATNSVIAENSISLNLNGVPSFTPFPYQAYATPTPKTFKTSRLRATATPRPRITARPTATPRTSAEIRSLDFSSRMWAQWEFKSGDILSICFEMENLSSKSVREFELYLYATDTRGNRIYGANQIYYATTVKTIASGRTAYSDYIAIPDESRIDRVYCGIKRVVLSDGTVEEVPDSRVDYSYWTIE